MRRHDHKACLAQFAVIQGYPTHYRHLRTIYESNFDLRACRKQQVQPFRTLPWLLDQIVLFLPET